jgi:hypothetical protein
MIVIARVARLRLDTSQAEPRGVRSLPPGAPSGPPRADARQRGATQARGRTERRACGASGGSGHAHGGDGGSTRGGREGGGGGGRPGRVEDLQVGPVVVWCDQVGAVREGGTAGRSPPPWGAGEGGRRGDEKGGRRDGGGESRGGERKSKRRERAAGGRGDLYVMYVDGPHFNGK